MNLRLVFLYIALAGIFSGGCGRGSSSAAPAATTAITVSGSHADVAERATRALRPSLAKQTEIARIDRSDEIVLRCSMIASDGSVRLIEVSLRRSANVDRAASTSVSAVSRAFSFVMKPSRDRLDAETETNVLALVRAAP